MYQVIPNEKAFQNWCESREGVHIKSVIEGTGAYNHLIKQLQTMDECYGEQRHLEKDLGGYMVILYGTEDEVQDSYKRILHYHHLKEAEYEYEELYSIESSYEWVNVRLYLCSSDYGTIIVRVYQNTVLHH